MSIELQIRSSALGNTTAHAVEARLRTTCFAPIGPGYIDHADVATAPVEIFAANGTVRLRVPMDVFAVQRADVLATPNATPTGATTTGRTVVLLLEMSMTATVLSVTCIDANLDALAPMLGGDASAGKATIIAGIGSALTLDLGPALQQLGMPSPNSSRIELIDGVVAIRFEPAGPAATHLFPGQDWGMFLDGAATEHLAKSKVPKAMSEKLSSLVLNARWQPAGTVPHVDIDYSGKAQAPDPFKGDVDGTFACDFALTSPVSRTLRTTVHWSLHLDMGDFAPAFIEKAVRTMIEVSIFFSVLKTGGVPVGDHTFALDSHLREVAPRGARFDCASMLASPAGMTIGGPVRWPVPSSRELVKPNVTNFGLPSRLEFCSILAKTGSGDPHWSATLDELRTNGRVYLEDGGTLCDVEIVSPGDWLKPYIIAPGIGGAVESDEIQVVIPSTVALGITAPVRLLVRTSRGVRLVDLGVPPAAIVDADGNVTNAVLSYIDDCLYFRPDDPFRIRWGDARELVVNPVDWLDYADALHGLDVQLVRFFRLEPGEILQFRSRDHQIDVTANSNGEAVVPVLLPLADQAGSATLTRVNRRSMERHFSVDSIIFLRQASLPAGLRSSLIAGIGGTARVTTAFDDRLAIHEIDRSGALISVGHEQISAANHQLPQLQQLSSRSKDRCTGLSGVIAVHPVPGFADASVAIATMDDGSRLVLDFNGDEARVAGTFAGPIGGMDLSDDWGLLAGSDRATIYRVTRSTQRRGLVAATGRA
jgi:hypothetical protein